MVVRVIYTAFGTDAYTGFFANHTLLLGNPGDLERELNLSSDRSLFERSLNLIYSVLLGVLALFLFALYFSRKNTLNTSGLPCMSLPRRPLALSNWLGAPLVSAHFSAPRSFSNSCSSPLIFSSNSSSHFSLSSRVGTFAP